MANYSQDLMWTVLPFGQSQVANTSGGIDHYLNFSVLVSPRLESVASTASLLNYPDWAGVPASTAVGGRSWPDTITAILPAVQLLLPAVQNGPSYPVRQVVGGPQPDPTQFAAIFPSTTLVTPYVYHGFDGRRVRSAPVASAVDTIASLYGRFGLTSPTAYPKYEDLVPAGAFGPLGFEQDNVGPAAAAGGGDPGIPGNGAQHRQILVQALEGAFTSSRTVPDDLSKLAAQAQAQALDLTIQGAQTSLTFLQHQRFLQRGIPASAALSAALTPPPLDFHQMVAAITSQPTLLRLLGLVLDLQAGPVPAGVVALWQQGLQTPVQLVVDPGQFIMTPHNVTPPTMAQLSPGVFRPASQGASSDISDRMLLMGDPSRYRVVTVDHDTAVVKAMQFADTVTRSRRDGAKLTLTTPDRFALPALRTGGFAVAQSKRATAMAETLRHQTADLEASYFPITVANAPALYEDDLTRGFRFDVLDEADGVWRSLMWRQGTVTVDGSAAVHVTEEDTVVPAPTSDPRSDGPQDLYLQETLTRWDGWSLAVPRLGTPFQDSGPSGQGSSGFHVTTAWHVPGSSTSGADETSTANAGRLPRLRFGRSYRLRARAADLAGNSFAVDQAPTSDAVVSPSVKHLRFEPVPAPRLLLVDAPGPGDSEEVVVIRSESATVDGTGLDNATAVRLVVPAPTSVFMAEQHGKFDGIGGGAPMDQGAYADLATRTAVRLEQNGALLEPSAPHSTANPFLYPGFLAINYLPEVLGRIALVRGLPANAAKDTVAQLSFDTAAKGWPKLQGVRISLSRGAVGWSTRTVSDPANGANVTTELDLTLDKGDMVTALVNAHIDVGIDQIMAVRQWIQQWAQSSGADPTAAFNAILAGEHWMVTPWREVTFVHAVRTPLANPQLLLDPTKTVIGQTYADFPGLTNAAKGTVLMNRKSTARIDVDGSWAMPIDTGSNVDPVTPQQFQGHAFTLELSRDGLGIDPTALRSSLVEEPNAENFDQQHEFNDTKFRAVTYRGTATSYYVEYFREKVALPVVPSPIASLIAAPYAPGRAFEASTVQLRVTWNDGGTKRTRLLVAAPPGTLLTVAKPTPGDYVVTEDPALATDPVHATHGSVQLLAQSGLKDADFPGATIEFSFVAPTIHTYSDPVADHTTSTQMHVPNSARPAAPDVRYVVPIYHRTSTATTAHRRGGALRVYLERPWWSSGDEERLGVVCWHRTPGSKALPAKALLPYVTLWGFDPVFASTRTMPGQPTPACFPLATAKSSNHSLTIEESATKVDVAGHSVGYDSSRGLWYCDIQVTDPHGKELATYTPFIRFALARYQPHSIAGAHLSKVVLVDYAQLAPNRSVTVTGSGSTRHVTVAGRAPVATDRQHKPSRMIVLVEQRDNRIKDDALAWHSAGGPAPFKSLVELTASTADHDIVTWHGKVTLPAGSTAPLRLTFEEYERIPGGAGYGRLVFTESLRVAKG